MFQIVTRVSHVQYRLRHVLLRKIVAQILNMLDQKLLQPLSDVYSVVVYLSSKLDSEPEYFAKNQQNKLRLLSIWILPYFVCIYQM